MKHVRNLLVWAFLFPATLSLLGWIEKGPKDMQTDKVDQDSTDWVVGLVKDASVLIRMKGEAAFRDFRMPGSRWRKGETYIFVLDPSGNMVVHNDPTMEGRNQMELRDVNGKPIVRGLLGAATPSSPEGWYHYEWPVPGGLLPRWKSSYVRWVKAPSGREFIVGCGVYDDRMQKPFVVDLVMDAVSEVERLGRVSFPRFHDPQGPYIAKDAYVFVIDDKGVDLVNPGFRNLEGRNIMDLTDAEGKYPIREMWRKVRDSGSGWVDYMWAKPGESVPTLKSTYVHKAVLDGGDVLVGSGVYLQDAPRSEGASLKMTADELKDLVREAAVVFEKEGENAFPTFRTKGSKWLHDDLYFFVWTMSGIRLLHPAEPQTEGQDVSDLKDVQDRPVGRMFLEAGRSETGEGWVHYQNTEPGKIFPIWKSSFVKRVVFPSGEIRLIGAGVYEMQMGREFIVDVVDRASALVGRRGADAFTTLSDATGPYRFMDTYVFVNDPVGTEILNPAQPSLQGKNLIDIRDAKGKQMVREYIEAAMRYDSAWVTYEWYRPGSNTPTTKHTYVRKVRFRDKTFIVGSGYYDALNEK
jgi:signal transduction histidine kinase